MDDKTLSPSELKAFAFALDKLVKIAENSIIGNDNIPDRFYNSLYDEYLSISDIVDSMESFSKYLEKQLED